MAILGGGTNPGTLQSSSGTGVFLSKTRAPVTYVAPATIEGDSLVVQVAAYAYIPVGGGGGGGGDGDGGFETSALAKVSHVSKKAQRQKTAQSVASNSDRSVLERIGKLLANNACVAGKAVVGGAQNIPSIIVLTSISSQQNDSVKVELKVTLYDADWKPIAPSEKVGIDFSLGYEAQGLGTLSLKDSNATGMTLTGVSYVKALNKSVIVMFDRKAYDGLFPMRVRVQASTEGKKGMISDDVTLSFAGQHTIGEYFNQGDSSWAKIEYDSTGSPIDSLGCALSGMAMILKATGIDVDPDTLNDFMNHHKGFLRGGVQWNAIIDFTGKKNSTLLPPELVPPGAVGLERTKSGLVGTPVPNETLTQYLSSGYLILAQVKNIKDKGKASRHWVVVTRDMGVTPEGKEVYSILDPGYLGRTTLQNYSNEVFRFVAYKKK